MNLPNLEQTETVIEHFINVKDIYFLNTYSQFLGQSMRN